MGVKKEVKVEESKYKAKLQIHFDGTTTIFRVGLPFVIDRTEKVAAWLEAQGIKSEEVEVDGDRKEVFGEEKTEVEKIA
jgi:hypothetical protein